MSLTDSGDSLKIELPETGYSIVILLVEDGKVVEQMLTQSDDAGGMYMCAYDVLEYAAGKIKERWPKRLEKDHGRA